MILLFDHILGQINAAMVSIGYFILRTFYQKTNKQKKEY